MTGFMAYWIGANVVGFVIGNFLGASHGGLIAGVAGDLVFGATFGSTQFWVLWRYRAGNAPKMGWWIAACAIGFTLGVAIGGRMALAVAANQFMAGVVFGACVGITIGIAQWIVLRKLGFAPKFSVWIAVSTVAWMVGESIAFIFYFRAEAVPLVAAAIATITGAVLVRLLPIV